jgi:hypothetical protein
MTTIATIAAFLKCPETGVCSPYSILCLDIQIKLMLGRVSPWRDTAIAYRCQMHGSPLPSPQHTHLPQFIFPNKQTCSPHSSSISRVLPPPCPNLRSSLTLVTVASFMIGLFATNVLQRWYPFPLPPPPPPTLYHRPLLSCPFHALLSCPFHFSLLFPGGRLGRISTPWVAAARTWPCSSPHGLPRPPPPPAPAPPPRKAPLAITITPPAMAAAGKPAAAAGASRRIRSER